jgi:DNA-binding GntR family transcriptional regulator
LVDACSKRNADQAVSLLRFHYGRTYEVMVYSGLAGSADV